MSQDYGQTLAAFVLDSGKRSRRLLKRIQEIDDVDPNVKIVDAAIADRTRFRVKVHQTEDLGGAKGTIRGAGLGVIVGAIVLGPAGAVVGGAAGGVLNGLRNRFHDIGISDKFMRQVTKELPTARAPSSSVRGELVRFDRVDPAGHNGREGAADPRAPCRPRRPSPSRRSSIRQRSSWAATRSCRITKSRSRRRLLRLPPRQPRPRLLTGSGAGRGCCPAGNPDDLTPVAGVGPKASAAPRRPRG